MKRKSGKGTRNCAASYHGAYDTPTYGSVFDLVRDDTHPYVQDRAIEKLWHMFIPPIMTYLDDYQAVYKLQGVGLVSLLLEKAPPGLLRRTGVDVLLATVRIIACFRVIE